MTSAIKIVRQFRGLKISSPECNGLLRKILYGDNFCTSLKDYHKHAQRFIDILDASLGAMTDTNSEFYRKILRALRKLCAETTLLPSTHLISEGLKKMGDSAVAFGGFSDVWKGSYEGRAVAIKMLRVTQVDEPQVKKLYCKEVVVWKRLSHKNVVPFLGVSQAFFKLSVVSEWMCNGTISEYLRSHPDANRLGLMIDVTNGLQFLHSELVIHGYLKDSNILVNAAGSACLVDFGLASITCNSLSINASTPGIRGSHRWMAPELLNPELLGSDADRLTEKSDVYSLAMIITEVLSGVSTFLGHNTTAVMIRVTTGARPRRQQHPNISDEIWGLVEICWRQNPDERPKAIDVLERLERAANPSYESTPKLSSVSASTRVVPTEDVEVMSKRGNIEFANSATPPSFLERLLRAFGRLRKTHLGQ